MKERPNTGGESVDALLQRAIEYAGHAMRSIGRVPPTFLAETDNGLMIYLPETMGDERAKDNFANTARLVAVGYSASAVAMILESWVTVAKPGKPLDPSVPPSQSPDREECVVIMVEGQKGEHRSKFLPIQRDARGRFTGFGGDEMPKFDQMEGRFVGILPTKALSEENRKMARQLLRMMGVAPENHGFNPMWN